MEKDEVLSDQIKSILNVYACDNNLSDFNGLIRHPLDGYDIDQKGSYLYLFYRIDNLGEDITFVSLQVNSCPRSDMDNKNYVSLEKTIAAGLLTIEVDNENKKNIGYLRLVFGQDLPFEKVFSSAANNLKDPLLMINKTFELIEKEVVFKIEGKTKRFSDVTSRTFK